MEWGSNEKIYKVRKKFDRNKPKIDYWSFQQTFWRPSAHTLNVMTQCYWPFILIFLHATMTWFANCHLLFVLNLNWRSSGDTYDLSFKNCYHLFGEQYKSWKMFSFHCKIALILSFSSSLIVAPFRNNLASVRQIYLLEIAIYLALDCETPRSCPCWLSIYYEMKCKLVEISFYAEHTWKIGYPLTEHVQKLV
jgi:hypothetical protein